MASRPSAGRPQRRPLPLRDGLAGTRAPGAPGICADLDSKWWWRCAKPALRVCAAESVSALLHLAAPCSTLRTVPGVLSALSYCTTPTKTPCEGSNQGQPAPLALDLHRGPRASASLTLGPALRFTRAELDAVDNQGRCVITDHGRLVLFNVYLPAVTRSGREGPEGDRFTHKMRMLQARLDSRLHVAVCRALGKPVGVGGGQPTLLTGRALEARALRACMRCHTANDTGV